MAEQPGSDNFSEKAAKELREMAKKTDLAADKEIAAAEFSETPKQNTSAQIPQTDMSQIKPTPIINEQPYKPILPTSISQVEKPSAPKPSKFYFAFLIVNILFGLFLIIFLSLIKRIVQPSKADLSAAEFAGLSVFAVLVPVVVYILLIYFIAYPIYDIKLRPSAKEVILIILSLTIPLAMLAYQSHDSYQRILDATKSVDEIAERSRQKLEEDQLELAAKNADAEITIERAINLLKGCEIKELHYSNQIFKHSGRWGESSTTGIVLTKTDNLTYKISIADRLIGELVPIARSAQETCAGLQLWHDGKYEQKQSHGTGS